MSSSATPVGSLPPIPTYDPISFVKRRDKYKPSETDPKEGKITERWNEWFTFFTTYVQSSPARINNIDLTGQNASIGATDIGTGAISAGKYRVTWYFRITQAASVSSSLELTIGWTESGVPITKSFGAETGNTTTTVQTLSAMVLADEVTPITIATTYASVGGTPMLYRISVVLERVQA